MLGVVNKESAPAISVLDTAADIRKLIYGDEYAIVAYTSELEPVWLEAYNEAAIFLRDDYSLNIIVNASYADRFNGL